MSTAIRCPFCKAVAVCHSQAENLSAPVLHQMRCTSCGARGPICEDIDEAASRLEIREGSKRL